jgi:nucleoside-diphosphate-sugar epimerase
MRLLVLGGNGWLSGYAADYARDRGDDVTCLSRGVSGPMPDGVTVVTGDRDTDGALDAVAEVDWDVVLDVSSQPGRVRRAVTALAPRTKWFVYVSSGSVYADPAESPDENADVVEPLPGDVMESMEQYGGAKVACEHHVRSAFGDRCVIARAGLIGGPGDDTTRSGYWPLRFARPSNPEGRVLVPDVPDLQTQLIDVRDLAAWLVEAGASGVSGTFNLVGVPMPLASHLAIAAEVAGFGGDRVGVSQDWLQDHDVNAWMGRRSLPLWLPLPEYAGFSSRNGDRARANGLVHRPLADTLRDTLDWELSRAPEVQRGAGLTDDEERDLLAAYDSGI